eukprot:m.6459 g.6459  ORF g.6459 m.6459 type:complete len:429 (-) comp2098_c0_seq2:208-1494(-)
MHNNTHPVNRAPLLPMHHTPHNVPVQPAFLESLFDGSAINGMLHRSTHRLIDRDASFSQSFGKMYLRRILPANVPSLIHLHDWYHTLLDTPTLFILLCIFALYITVALVWACWWWLISDRCDLKMTNFMDAVLFSANTLATIGYGVPDVYFNSCPEALFVMLTEFCFTLFLDAMCVSLVFLRLSRSTRRGLSVLFSSKAVMTLIRGQWHLLFQVADCRSLQAIDVSIRCYAVRHVKDARGRGAYFQYHNMRLNHPADDLGGRVLLEVPCLVTHRLDAWSPLTPPDNPAASVSNTFRYPDVLQRAADYDAGNRYVANDELPTLQPSNCPPHRLPGGSVRALTQDEIMKFWIESSVEIVVVLEGIEHISAGSFQKRYSYRPEDIVWNEMFVPLVNIGPDGFCVVDLTKLHDTEQLMPEDEQGFPPPASIH